MTDLRALLQEAREQMIALTPGLSRNVLVERIDHALAEKAPEAGGRAMKTEPKLMRIAQTALCLLLASAIVLFVSDVYPFLGDWQLKLAVGVILSTFALIAIGLSLYIVWKD
jgi:hypothetical protein